MKLSKSVWLVIAGGFAVRLLLWCFQSIPEGDDGLRYLAESVNLVKYGVFSIAAYPAAHGIPSPSAHDLPLWAGIMAVAYWITDSVRATQYVAGFINVLLSALGAIALAGLLKAKPFCCRDRAIAIGCAVYVFMPEAIVYSLCHMPDQLAVTCVTIGLASYFRGVYECRKWLLASSAAFLAAIYSKPICIPLTVALFVALPSLLRGNLWKRLLPPVVCLLIVFAGLCPWVLRNQRAYGTSGLTTISGTNLYYCNWGWYVNSMPSPQKEQEQQAMRAQEKACEGDDDMLRSKKLGAYARGRLLANLPGYIGFTLKRHPRLYAGSGAVALFRYLGLHRLLDCLDSTLVTSVARGEVQYEKTYSAWEKVISIGLQAFFWILQFSGYLLVLVGVYRGFLLAKNGDCAAWLVYLCPILCLLLLAMVIGPVVATRYRFIMIPFFAIISSTVMGKGPGPMPVKEM